MAVLHAVGDILGNYNLLAKVGEGSMGTVYKASHWTTHEIVAIKVMPLNIARKPSLLKRFEQEFRLASKVNHPNVVRSLEYSGCGAEPYLVMEFVEGVSMGDRIEQRGAMPEQEAVSIIAQVAAGLHHAHGQGLLHRDVKPDNILVTPSGVAKLTDLGLAKDTDGEEELTRTGSGLGTPNFMAPEQFRNAKHAGVQADVYSLGATLFQMLTGELPFGHGDPVRMLMRKMKNELTPVRKLAPKVSERTERVIRRAMSPVPEDRQESCQEFLDELLGRPPSTPLPPQGRLSDVLRRPGEVRKTDAVSRAEIEAHLVEARAERAPVKMYPPSPPPMPQGTHDPRPTPMPPLVLQSARYLPPPEPEPPPPPVPQIVVAQAPGDGWTTAVIVVVTCLATLVLSQLLFGFFK